MCLNIAEGAGEHRSSKGKGKGKGKKGTLNTYRLSTVPYNHHSGFKTGMGALVAARQAMSCW